MSWCFCNVCGFDRSHDVYNRPFDSVARARRRTFTRLNDDRSPLWLRFGVHNFRTEASPENRHRMIETFSCSTAHESLPSQHKRGCKAEMIGGRQQIDDKHVWRNEQMPG